MTFRYPTGKRESSAIRGHERAYAMLHDTSLVSISLSDDLPHGTRAVMLYWGKHTRTITPKQFRDSQYARRMN